jgi:hypothetical protein
LAKSDKKEHCPRCNGTLYAVAQDKSNKHYCQTKGCGNVWVPGLTNLNRTDLVLKQALQEKVDLQREVDRVRAENKMLREKLAKYEPVDAPVTDATAEEIFK